MHGPLKDAYQLRTNFKEVAEQILRVDSWCNAAGFIQQQINVQDELRKAWQQADEEIIENEIEEQPHDYSGKATLHGNHGKGGGTMTIKELMDSKREDIALETFPHKLSKYVKKLFKDPTPCCSCCRRRQVPVQGVFRGWKGKWYTFSSFISPQLTNWPSDTALWNNQSQLWKHHELDITYRHFAV